MNQIEKYGIALIDKLEELDAPSIRIEQIHPAQETFHKYCKTCEYYSSSEYLRCAVHPCGPQRSKCPDYQKISFVVKHPLPITYHLLAINHDQQPT
ncbi:DUF6464 family protein [Microseira sp. BLCC-F43]|jgi:hypothetical protein|uniref:DUF6464 family protein n=1 Tax=Microseira sp. BLCC-F43 TaxID=3153602 RepID=UPI0035B9403C